MNEWSPGGNYSHPGTPNQTGRSFRSQWEDTEKGAKPLIVNIRAVSDKSKPPPYQQQQPTQQQQQQQQHQHSLEDVTKSSLSIVSKNKKNGADGSDPRFKRVISNGLQNDACVGTEAGQGKKRTPGPPAKVEEKQKHPVWAASGDAKFEKVLDRTEAVNQSEDLYAKSEEPEASSKEHQQVVPDSEQDVQHELKGIDKLLFNPDVEKSLSKESLSNCTVNTINTSLASDDFLEDGKNNLMSLPSASRVKKVQNWMLDQKPKTEKKQSLITVIGQTQGHDTLSSALREIDKRRKLVKELDKYAMCKKIIETEKGKDVPEVVAKITAVSSARRHCKNDSDDSKHRSPSRNGSGDRARKPQDKDEKVVVLLSSAVGTESSSPEVQKRSSSKRKSRKSHLNIDDCPVKGKFNAFYTRLQYQWLFYVVFLISGILCWMTFLSLHTGSYVSFEFFTKKPKTMTWYEKICMWLWELFRPSSETAAEERWFRWFEGGDRATGVSPILCIGSVLLISVCLHSIYLIYTLFIL